MKSFKCLFFNANCKSHNTVNRKTSNSSRVMSLQRAKWPFGRTIIFNRARIFLSAESICHKLGSLVRIKVFTVFTRTATLYFRSILTHSPAYNFNKMSLDHYKRPFYIHISNIKSVIYNYDGPVIRLVALKVVSPGANKIEDISS